MYHDPLRRNLTDELPRACTWFGPKNGVHGITIALPRGDQPFHGAPVAGAVDLAHHLLLLHEAQRLARSVTEGIHCCGALGLHPLIGKAVLHQVDQTATIIERVAIDVDVPLLPLVPRAAAGALDDGICRGELRVQVLAGDVQANFDGLRGHGNPSARILVLLAEHLAQYGLDARPILRQKARVQKQHPGVAACRVVAEGAVHRLGAPNLVANDHRAVPVAPVHGVGGQRLIGQVVPTHLLLGLERDHLVAGGIVLRHHHGV